MNRVALLYNNEVEQAAGLCAEVAGWLNGQGKETSCVAVQDIDDGDRIENPELVVVLGGDGTTLTAARTVAQPGVPIFGINLGKVGFLSEATPDDWRVKLRLVLKGDHWIEKRLMLFGQVVAGGVKMGKLIALNDIVVSRGEQTRMLRAHLSVDGALVSTYSADALIVSTPTGSTAYSMAAGGPLLPPEMQNFLVIPVAPHLSFERAVVLHKDAVVGIRVETQSSAKVTADGQDVVQLEDGDEVIVENSNIVARFARLESQGYFYRRLMQRLSYWSRGN